MLLIHYYYNVQKCCDLTYYITTEKTTHKQICQTHNVTNNQHILLHMLFFSCCSLINVRRILILSDIFKRAAAEKVQNFVLLSFGQPNYCLSLLCSLISNSRTNNFLMSPVLRIKSNFKGSSLVCSKHYW